MPTGIVSTQVVRWPLPRFAGYIDQTWDPFFGEISRSWCSFCLVAAMILRPMIPLEVEEVVAMGPAARALRCAVDVLLERILEGRPARTRRPTNAHRT